MPLWKHNGHVWQEIHLQGTAAGTVGFIVANGPSLNEINTRRLQGPGRTVLALNNAYPAVRPDYWIGMEHAACYDPQLLHEAFPKIMRLGQHAAAPAVFVPSIQENVRFYDGTEPAASFRWDKDTFRMAIQFALYLGLKTLVFVGVDLDNTTADYAENSNLTHEQRGYNQRLYDQTFEWLREFARSHPEIRLLSASPGSKINDVMTYSALSEILAMCETGLSIQPRKSHVLA